MLEEKQQLADTYEMRIKHLSQTVQRLLRNQQQTSAASGAAAAPMVAGAAAGERTCVDCVTSASPVHADGAGGGCCGAEADANERFSRLAPAKPLRASMLELEAAAAAASASVIGPASTSTTATSTTPAPRGELSVRAPEPRALAIETHTVEVVERCTESKTRCSAERERNRQAQPVSQALVAQVVPCRAANVPPAFLPKGSSSDSAQTSPGSGSGSGCSSCASGSGTRGGPDTSSSPHEKGRDQCSCASASSKKARRHTKKMPEICRSHGGKGHYAGLAGPPQPDGEADGDYPEDRPPHRLPRLCKCWIFCVKQG